MSILVPVEHDLPGFVQFFAKLTTGPMITGAMIYAPFWIGHKFLKNWGIIK